MTESTKIAPGFHASWAEVDMAGWRWPNFTPRELACKCGGRHCRGEYFHDPVFLDALQGLREDMGAPLVITSGRRCAGHNAAVRGATRSQHLLRIAADISLMGHDRRKLARAAHARRFTGIGFGASFLHVDMRPAAKAAWNYNAASIRLWRRAFGFDPAAKLQSGWVL